MLRIEVFPKCEKRISFGKYRIQFAHKAIALDLQTIYEVIHMNRFIKTLRRPSDREKFSPHFYIKSSSRGRVSCPNSSEPQCQYQARQIEILGLAFVNLTALKDTDFGMMLKQWCRKRSKLSHRATAGFEENGLVCIGNRGHP
jgi:hypothetical protein